MSRRLARWAFVLAVASCACAARVLAQSGETSGDVRPPSATPPSAPPAPDAGPNESPVDDVLVEDAIDEAAPIEEGSAEETEASEDDEATEADDAWEDDDAPAYGAHAHVRLGIDSPPTRTASDFSYDPEAYRVIPRRTADSLLTLAPGLVLANHGGIGHASTIYLRGFDAGEGQDVLFEVDGVILNEPSNPHGNGYADPGYLPIESIRRVIVREGPYDPRQASYTVAGSVRYELGIAERGIRVGGRYGSFNTWRAFAIYAPPGEEEGTFVEVDAVKSDGFGPNRANETVRAIGRLEKHVNGVAYSLLGSASAQRFDSAGVIPERAYDARTLPCAPSQRAQFFCVVDPNQGGSGQRALLQGRIALDRPGFTYEQVAYLMLRTDRFLDDFTGIAQDARGDGLDQRYHALTAGLRGAYRLSGRFLKAPQTFELGYLGRYDDATAQMDRVRFTDGIPYKNVFASELHLVEIAGYGLFDLALGRYVTAQGGLRLEGFAAEVTHENLPTSDRTGPRLPTQTVSTFGLALLPRGVLSFHVHESLDLILAAGIGTRPADAQWLSDGEQAPFTRADAFEAGVLHRFRRGTVSLVSRAALFATVVANDLVFDPDQGRNVPIGKTNRFGTMAATTLEVGTRFNAQVSFTWAEAHIPPAGASPFALGSGPNVPFIPRIVGRLDAAYHDTFRVKRESIRVSAGLGASFIGRKPLPYDQLSHRITVFEAGAAIRYRFVSFELFVENLFNSLYRNFELAATADFSPTDGLPSGSAMPQRLFAAGAPRNIFFLLTFYLDPTHFTETATP